jgi:hypothetical protein
MSTGIVCIGIILLLFLIVVFLRRSDSEIPEERISAAGGTNSPLKKLYK